MKLLFYNWAPVEGQIGGGVAVYQKNLFKYLLETGQHELYFLTSGLFYTSDRSNIYIEKVDNKVSDKIKTFNIVNSPVIAPAQQSIINIRHYLEDTKLYEILKKFINDSGGFDVIHFNNMEGLSINVLKLKEIFPKTKFIFSVHNYFLICSKVSLWQSPKIGENHNCDKTDYSVCANCYRKLNYNSELFYRGCPKILQKIRGFRRLLYMYADFFPDTDDLDLYRRFEEQNILYSNKYFDAILAVSNRVKEIFVSHGFEENKVHLSYIGTDVAEIQTNTNSADINENPFRIIYMSYMNEEKGFFFLLKAMQEMSEELASNIVVTVVAGHGIREFFTVRKLNSLKGKFKDIILKNGYKREEQKEILQGQHLGVVPVVWEDNLPQTAIEQMAYGVPILCSNLGGASELSNRNPDFTFEAGNVNEFLQKIEKIIKNRNLLKTFWNNVQTLATMKEHVNFLEQIYNS